MATWRGGVQYNGEERSYFDSVEFAISDELKAKIDAAIDAGKPLRDCDFYDALTLSAEVASDLVELSGIADEEPNEDDYDDEDEYEEALEEYNDALDRLEEFCTVWTWIVDPGDMTRFKEQFVGREVELDDGEHLYEYDQYDELVANYEVTVKIEDGCIVDIIKVYAEGLESGDFRSASYEEIYPDYDYIADLLEDDLFADEA